MGTGDAPIVVDAESAMMVLAAFLALFLLEHYGRKNDHGWIRLSTYVWTVYNFVSPWVRWLGVLTADALAFLTLIDVAEIAITAQQMFEPCARLGAMFMDYLTAIEMRVKQCNTADAVFLGALTISVMFIFTLMKGLNIYTVFVDGVFLIMMVYSVWINYVEPSAPEPAAPVADPAPTPASPPPRRRTGRGRRNLDTIY